jgi:hypothetical protein
MRVEHENVGGYCDECRDGTRATVRVELPFCFACSMMMVGRTLLCDSCWERLVNLLQGKRAQRPLTPAMLVGKATTPALCAKCGEPIPVHAEDPADALVNTQDELLHRRCYDDGAGGGEFSTVWLGHTDACPDCGQTGFHKCPGPGAKG